MPAKIRRRTSIAGMARSYGLMASKRAQQVVGESKKSPLSAGQRVTHEIRGSQPVACSKIT
jgi:hypothetical protein